MILRQLLKLWLKLFFRLEVKGIENLAQVQQTWILAGNHTGLMDGFIISAILNKPFKFLVKEEVIHWPLVGQLLKHCNILVLPTSNHKKALEVTIQALEKGHNVCIFPEGKLTTTGKLNAFKNGTAFLHQKSGAPIIPFAIKGGFEAWQYGQLLPKLHKISIQFGTPITYSETRNRTKTTELLYQQVQKLLIPTETTKPKQTKWQKWPQSA